MKFGQNSKILYVIVWFCMVVVCGFREVMCGFREVICGSGRLSVSSGRLSAWVSKSGRLVEQMDG